MVEPLKRIMNRKLGALALVAVSIICILGYSFTLLTNNSFQFELFTRGHNVRERSNEGSGSGTGTHSGTESGSGIFSGDEYSGSGSGSGKGSGFYPSPSPTVDPTCQAFQQLAASPAGTCTTSDQCTGIICTVVGVGSIDVRVEPCHNPPAVQVVARDGSGEVTVNETLTHSRQQPLPGGIGSLNVNIEQSTNEDSLTLSVLTVVGGVPFTIIPETTIPLNREQCPRSTKPPQSISATPQPSPTPGVGDTCAALEQLASISPVCVTSDQCTGLFCLVPGIGSFDFMVEPCHNPPAIQVIGRNSSGDIIIDEVLTQSRQQTLPGEIGTLSINIEQSQNEDSLSFSVTGMLGGLPLTIIPETTIPLNRDQCPRSTQSISATPQPSPTPGVGDTCAALEQLASTSPVCVTSDQCTGLFCQVPGVGSFDFMVEPCHNPPAIQVIGRNSSGDIIIDEVLTQSRQQELPGGSGTLSINIEQSPNEDSLSLSVTGVIGGIMLPIIPETTIPLNREQCPQSTRAPQSISTTPQPSPTPGVGATCAALEQLASTSVCVTSDQCTGLLCQVPGFGSFDFMIEPCHNPPAIQVIGRNSSGDVIVNETLTNSRQQDLLGLGTLNINVQQAPNEDSITFSVAIASIIPAVPPLSIIPETRIPIDRTQCDSKHSVVPTLHHTFTVPPVLQTWTPTVTSMNYTLSSTNNPAVSTESSVTPTEQTKPSAGPNQTITVAVAVSVSVILVVVGSVVFLIAILIMIRRRKRLHREYNFQRMTFNNDNDDDDDDEDL